jgi:hypothetical protein
VNGLFETQYPQSVRQPLGPDRITLDGDNASPTPCELDRKIAATSAELDDELARVGAGG